MSVLEQIQALEDQKKKLLNDAKKELIAKAEAAISDLNNLGFSYQLVEAGGSTSAGGGRRSNVSGEVLKVVKAAANGLPRAAVLEQMQAHDKSAQQSVSNALSNLKKKGHLTLTDGVYKSV